MSTRHGQANQRLSVDACAVLPALGLLSLTDRPAQLKAAPKTQQPHRQGNIASPPQDELQPVMVSNQEIRRVDRARTQKTVYELKAMSDDELKKAADALRKSLTETQKLNKEWSAFYDIKIKIKEETKSLTDVLNTDPLDDKMWKGVPRENAITPGILDVKNEFHFLDEEWLKNNNVTGPEESHKFPINEIKNTIGPWLAEHLNLLRNVADGSVIRRKCAQDGADSINGMKKFAFTFFNLVREPDTAGNITAGNITAGNITYENITNEVINDVSKPDYQGSHRKTDYIDEFLEKMGKLNTSYHVPLPPGYLTFHRPLDIMNKFYTIKSENTTEKSENTTEKSENTTVKKKPPKPPKPYELLYFGPKSWLDWRTNFKSTTSQSPFTRDKSPKEAWKNFLKVDKVDNKRKSGTQLDPAAQLDPGTELEPGDDDPRFQFANNARFFAGGAENTDCQ
jgi:hypothetical protein